MASRFIIPLLLTTLYAQASAPIRYWSQGSITWALFQGTPPAASHYDALIASGIQVTTKDSANTLIVETQSYMSPEDSWVKEEAKNEHLLNHEKLHFDITEINRRKMMRFLSTTVGYTSENFESKVDQAFDDALSEQEKMNAAYDRDTKHSSVKEQQKVWDLRVEKLLVDLNEYAGERVILGQ